VAFLLAGLGAVLATWGASNLGSLDEHAVTFVTTWPNGITRWLVELVQLLAVLVPLVAIAVLTYLRRFRALLYAAGVAAVAAFVAHVIIHALDFDAPANYQQLLHRDALIGDYAFPDAAYLAAAVAVATAVGPFITRSWRRVVWTALIVAVFIRILTGTALGSGLLLALSLGWAIGSAALLIFGAPAWAPSVDDIEDAMARAGMPLRNLERASVDARGSVPWFGTTTDGKDVFVKVLGRDQRSGDLLFRAYRFLRSKNLDDQRPFSSLRRSVEHEAFISLDAQRWGVRTPPFVAMATVGARDDAFLLAYERIAGRSLDEVEADAIDDDLLRAIWQVVAELREHRIAHRDLRFANVFLDDDGAPWIIDFGFSEVAASDELLAIDVAVLLVASAVRVGAKRAVDVACRVLGADAVARALPVIQPAALPSATRHAVKSDKHVVDEVRAEIRKVSGVEDTPLENLERIRPRTVALVVGLGIAIYVLYPQLADLSSAVEHVGSANKAWFAVVLLCSAFTYVGATVSFLGSVPGTLPPSPTFLAQLASSAANRITPASAGGYAVNVRYMQREGVDTTTAVTAVGINTVGGVLVHVPLLIIFLVWAGQKGTGPFHVPSARTFTLIAIGFALISVVIIAIPRLRRFVFGHGIAALSKARTGLADVARRPSKLLMLLGGSFLVTFTYICALAASVQAYGGGVSFVTIAAAYLAGSVIGQAAPTPGGLGAVEAALFAALTVGGLNKTIALSSVFTFRFATFWLPIIPGWISLRVMRARGEL
jgi:undecaprenyl-diphosphatase